MVYNEKELQEMADIDLSQKEKEALFKVMFRMGVDIDESARYVGWYMQMKVFGTFAFRIIHSHPSWIRSKKLFREYGIDLEQDLPQRTLLGGRIIAVRLFDKDYPGVTDLWAALTGVKRRDGTMRQNRKMSEFDLTPDLG